VYRSALPQLGGEVFLRSVRANASRKSHAELDESPDLDTGDPVQLARDYLGLRAQYPQISIVGGCCGTDARHIRAIAGTVLATSGGGPARPALLSRAG
jgi:methionine synthase I (cobalamin-dependent)